MNLDDVLLLKYIMMIHSFLLAYCFCTNSPVLSDLELPLALLFHQYDGL